MGMYRLKGILKVIEPKELIDSEYAELSKDHCSHNHPDCDLYFQKNDFVAVNND
jgi:hypothetical protein